MYLKARPIFFRGLGMLLVINLGIILSLPAEDLKPNKENPKPKDPGTPSVQSTRLPTQQQIKQRLQTVKFSWDIQALTLEEIIGFWHELSGIRFIIDPRVTEKVGSKKITLVLKEVSLETALSQVQEFLGLRSIYKQGAILILPQGVFDDSEFILRVYYIQDLLIPIPDFPGPDISLTEAGGGVNLAAGPAVEPEPRALTREDLEKLIKTITGGDSWQTDERVGLYFARDLMLVRHTREVHQQIVHLLNELRFYKR
jgi:hypothetical protein